MAPDGKLEFQEEIKNTAVEMYVNVNENGFYKILVLWKIFKKWKHPITTLKSGKRINIF